MDYRPPRRVEEADSAATIADKVLYVSNCIPMEVWAGVVERFDVVVVGSGNAGVSAALSARERGASVCVVEKAPRTWAGGNTYFTAGAYRTTYESLADLRALVEVSDEDAEIIDLAAYGPDRLFDDLRRVTQGRADPQLARILADESAAAAAWLGDHGVRWKLLVERQSFRVDGRIRFWGNLVLGSVDGGRGLVEAQLAALERAGVELRFDSPMTAFRWTDGRISGVTCNGSREIEAGAVVIAAGGFESDARRRSENLGEAWSLAKVRGTPNNTGEVLFLALEAGAVAHGDWTGCHAIAWDAAAPPHGDRQLTNRFSRQAYPFGLVVNRDGRRFLDEGADFRNYTYAKYGAEILRQPEGIAYQLFDAQTLPYLSEVDYATATTSRVEAESIEELEAAIATPPGELVRTIEAYNRAVRPGRFDPTSKDGKRTERLVPPKSNWALPYTQPPFVAYAVTCGITFTFGGVKIDPQGRVMRENDEPVEGLFACGELVGGMFYHNYPGGSGLAAGTVFGRRAGRAAVEFAQRTLAGSAERGLSSP